MTIKNVVLLLLLLLIAIISVRFVVQIWPPKDLAFVSVHLGQSIGRQYSTDFGGKRPGRVDTVVEFRSSKDLAHISRKTELLMGWYAQAYFCGAKKREMQPFVWVYDRWGYVGDTLIVRPTVDSNLYHFYLSTTDIVENDRDATKFRYDLTKGQRDVCFQLKTEVPYTGIWLSTNEVRIPAVALKKAVAKD
jgi:hypothetical protein